MRAWDCIDGNLWQGGTPETFGGGRAPREFDFIVNLYPWGKYETSENQVVTVVRMLDTAAMPDPRLLVALADYVNAVRRIGPTLVHCQMGLNRSGLIVGLSLIRSGMEPARAIALIRDKRRDALCNYTFEQWLLKQGSANAQPVAA